MRLVGSLANARGRPASSSTEPCASCGAGSRQMVCRRKRVGVFAVDMDAVLKQHLQAKRAAMNPPAGFHDRLVARLDRSSPRKPFRALPQLAMALGVVLGA